MPSNGPSSLSVRLETGATTALVYPASGHIVGATIVLGHGAGAGQRSAFMVEYARALAALGVEVVTFNFPYTEQHRRIPDRGPVLEGCFRAVIATVHERLPAARQGVFAGGKSMGGRIATQVAASDPSAPIAGLVLLGYPLHPPGKPHERRDKHFAAIRRPMLFVQGSRDAFGTPEELQPAIDALSPRPALYVVEGGDHSFKLSRKDPAAQAAAHANVQQTIVSWIRRVISGT